jgi:hypothetical protein
MNAVEDWRNIKYRETFEAELRGLERRRAADPSCKIEDIEGTLKNLYIMEGQDWLGRGEVQDIALSAAIAAHERFIDEWKSGESDHFIRSGV